MSGCSQRGVRHGPFGGYVLVKKFLEKTVAGARKHDGPMRSTGAYRARYMMSAHPWKRRRSSSGNSGAQTRSARTRHRAECGSRRSSVFSDGGQWILLMGVALFACSIPARRASSSESPARPRCYPTNRRARRFRRPACPCVAPATPPGGGSAEGHAHADLTGLRGDEAREQAVDPEGGEQQPKSGEDDDRPGEGPEVGQPLLDERTSDGRALELPSQITWATALSDRPDKRLGRPLGPDGQMDPPGGETARADNTSDMGSLARRLPDGPHSRRHRRRPSRP